MISPVTGSIISVGSITASSCRSGRPRNTGKQTVPLKGQIESQLTTLRTRESNLLDLAADGTLERDQIRERMSTIAAERAKLNGQLASIADDLDDGVDFIEANLKLLEDPYELYIRADDELRRRINQAVYKYVSISDPDGISAAELDDPLGDLMTAQDVMHARHYYLHDEKQLTDVARSWVIGRNAWMGCGVRGGIPG